MSEIHSILFVGHILFGAAALVLFWIPVMTKKGQLNHINFGRYYSTAMYAVALTGALMASLVLLSPSIHAQWATAEQLTPEIVSAIRTQAGFLLYLSLVSFASTRHGMAVLEAKADRQQLRTFIYIAPLVLLVLGGAVCFYVGWQTNRTLLMVFGVLGIVIGSGMLRYCLRDSIKRNQWVLEHLGAMIGSGIGAYTAFIAFGGRTLFSGLGMWQIAFWIAPGVIGGIAANVIATHYAKKLKLAQQPSL